MKNLSLIAAVLLAGCGGGGSITVTSSPSPEKNPPMIDVFFASVSGVVSAAPEDTEAANIDALATTVPDDSEPSTL